MFGIGPMELVLILVVALLVLGPKRMPELARTLGRGLGEFRRASNDLRQSLALDDVQNELRDSLANAGKTHEPVKRPEADDRPPQAGDDLAPGEDANETDSGEQALDADPNAHPDEPETASSASTPPSAPSAADADLGNVPVGDSAKRSPGTKDPHG